MPVPYRLVLEIELYDEAEKVLGFELPEISGCVSFENDLEINGRYIRFEGEVHVGAEWSRLQYSEMLGKELKKLNTKFIQVRMNPMDAWAFEETYL